MLESGQPAHPATRCHLTKPLAWSGAAVLALLLGAKTACPTTVCQPGALDIAGLSLAHTWQTGWIDTALGSATWLGSLWLLLPLSLLVAWRESQHQGWSRALFVPASLLSVVVIGQLAKQLVDRPRPDLFPALTDIPSDASFPSGHTMQITAFALAWLLRPGASVSPTVFAAAILLIATVAISRIYLQVHFPTDVIFGMLAAACCVSALREHPVWREKHR